MSLIPTYPAELVYEAAFNVAPSQATLPPYWSDITARTTFAWNTTRGRQYELDTVPAGQWNTALDNRDGALDPSNTSSPFYPNVIPYRGCRIRAMTGVNQLTFDQATAGSAGGYLGAIPPQMNVTNDFGYPVTIVANGSAYQGSSVYQVVLPSGAVAFATVLLMTSITVVPGTTYSATVQARITAGTSMSTNVGLLWYSNTGVSLGASGGTAQTLTSGSNAWTALSASGQAPAGATCAYLKVEIASGTTGAQTTWQIDGLQFEASATPTSFQLPQAISPNLLPRVIATGSASMAQTDTVAAHWYATAGTIAQANFLAAAPSGQTTAVSWTTPAGTTSSSPLYAGAVAANAASPIGPVQDCIQVTAGTQYTASAYLSRLASADATVQVQASWRWVDVNGNPVSTSSGAAVTVPTSGWVRSTCTATAPVGAAWGRPRLFISSPAATTAQNVIYATGWQAEAAPSATAWADPGPTYYIYTGYIERWPQTWTMSGTYGQVGAIGVDAEALIAQDILLDPFVEEVLSLGPNFFYTLSDPEGSTSCADASANRPPAPVENSPFGAGSLVFGSSITSTTTAGTFLGGAGPVATFANNSSDPGATAQFNETFISLHKTTSTPGPPSAGNWTRIIHFRIPAAPASGHSFALWEALPPTWSSSGNGSAFDIGAIAGNPLFVSVGGSNGTFYRYIGTSTVCDGDWHQVIVTCTSSGVVTVYLDGVSVGSGSFTLPISGITSDAIGASIQLGANVYRAGAVGDVAHVIEYPTVLSTPQITNLYNSFRSASAGESSGARAQRVLQSWLGYTGQVAIDTGSTSNMGPANDLTGATGLDALNAVALTENGNFYVSSSGVPTFKSRASRYNQNSPSMVFGEQAQWGEWPYESISLDFDPTHLFNDIQVTQYSTSQVAESISAASEELYYQRVLQRTTNQGAYTETIDCANYLLQQYSSTRMRISDITLHPAAVPGLFAACLRLEIGARVRVMRRPPQAPAIQTDCFVESINWDVDPNGDATVHLQCSPADLATYWILGALHTTLNAQAAAGQATATINALPDAAFNALTSSLPHGYQLTFDPGTSIAETMTIAPAGFPATAVGYSTATLTFTSNFANTHAAGAIVCEPLPATVTDPTVYDAGTVLAPTSTTLATAASAGASTITVNALSDTAANGIGSDLVPGDVLWVGVGGADFEGYNLLHPNLATAGAGALPLAVGSSGVAYGVSSDLGTPVVASSGSAVQGSTVWQLSVAANASTPSGLMYLVKLPATAGLNFTASTYVRSATSGANPHLYIYLKYLDGNGNFLTQTQSATSTLTGSASAAWTRITVTASAPTGAVWAQVGIVLATAPTSAWVFQADALQYEQAPSASTFQICPQVLSVGASVPGNANATLTLNTPLASSHAAGEIVCDPLPPGSALPSAVPATTRVTY